MKLTPQNGLKVSTENRNRQLKLSGRLWIKIEGKIFKIFKFLDNLLFFHMDKTPSDFHPRVTP